MAPCQGLAVRLLLPLKARALSLGLGVKRLAGAITALY